MRRAGVRPVLAAASAGRGAVRSAGRAPGTAADGASGMAGIAVAPDSPAAPAPVRRRHRWARRPALWVTGVLSAGALAGCLLNPAAQAAGLPAKHSQPFNGTDAVGALFTEANGKLVAHFCTASVVHSRAGNLLITAAHCVFRNKQPPPGSLAFVPGYHSGKTPRGVWGISAVYVNKAWQLHRNVNNDVAFLIAGRRAPILNGIPELRSSALTGRHSSCG